MERSEASRFRAALLRWYRVHGRDLPWRKTRDPYAVLISELMLQQQTVVRVVPVYEAFLRTFPDVRALAAARRSDVVRLWSTIGLNRQAVRAHELARRLVADGGNVPRGESALVGLPGVGRYTAAAVRCFAFGERVAMVDTNIRRVLSRVMGGDDEALDLTEAWQAAERMLPRRATDAYDWNQGLMDLGATVCRARAPRCDECPIRAVCSAAARPRAQEIREARASYGGGVTRRYEGSTRQLRGRLVRHFAALPDGASLTAAALARAVGVGPPTSDNVQLTGALTALVDAGVLSQRRTARRTARYTLAEG